MQLKELFILSVVKYISSISYLGDLLLIWVEWLKTTSFSKQINKALMETVELQKAYSLMPHSSVWQLPAPDSYWALEMCSFAVCTLIVKYILTSKNLL